MKKILNSIEFNDVNYFFTIVTNVEKHDKKRKLLNHKKNIVDQEGKVYNIVWAYCDSELDKFNGDKKGFIHIKYKKDKIFCSVLLKETNQ